MNKRYVRDQVSSWMQEFYLPALNRPMNIMYSGGKKYKLNSTFNRVKKPLLELLKEVSNKDYSSELDVLLYHVALALKNGQVSMVVDRNYNSFNNKKISYIKWIEMLDYLESYNILYNYIGNKGSEVKNKTFTKKQGVVYKTHLSVVIFDDKFINLFKDLPKRIYPKVEILSPKDSLELRSKVKALNSKGQPLLDKYGNQVYKKVKIEGVVRGARPFRRDINTINNFLATKDIRTNYGVSLSVFYYRLFGETLKDYGRFYSSFSNLPKELRRSLLFNGESVIEKDYFSNHAMILYTLEGIKVEDDFEPYTTGNAEEVLKDFSIEDHRGIYKIALLACVSAKTKKGLNISVYNELTSAGFNIKRGLTKLIVDDLANHNKRIAHYFGSDMSAKLQKIDSDIACEVMLSLIPYDKAFMCYHDSFITSSSLEVVLVKVMESSWKRILGNNDNCRIS